MKIAFHVYGFGLRGTEVATYDYAHFNQEILGNESIIVAPSKNCDLHPDVYAKFSRRFQIVFYDDRNDLAKKLDGAKADVFYCMKGGGNDGVAVGNVKTCIHAVFRSTDFHGDVYAYISRWLSQELTKGAAAFVPYIVHLPETAIDLRAALGIPRSAYVFGRHGGESTFNIRFVHNVVRELSLKRSDVYFLFMNTRPVLRSRLLRTPLRRKNLIYLPPTADLVAKAQFINTCDAMLHARSDGETFGLAVAEFSLKNKPVLTYSGSEDKAHIDMLGKRGIYYSNAEELAGLIESFRPDPTANWDAYSEDYSPVRVMEQFRNVFLVDPLTPSIKD